MAEKLFGTDGIRGVANRYPVSCEISLKIGRAAGMLARKLDFKSIVIGRDTRESGEMLEAALISGILSTGINALPAGIIPTPGVAYLTAGHGDAGLGIVISASHNPYQDNGIKIFTHQGKKLDRSDQEFIENFIQSDDNYSGSYNIGRISAIANANQKYADFLRSTLDFKLFKQKLNIVIDCSNGAAWNTVPLVFDPEYFNTRIIFNKPDGKNINKNCGSQFTTTLAEQVVKNRFDIGLGFDGDADRLITVDENGDEVKGDRILAICAEFYKNRGLLENNMVVSTIMSNIGLGIFLKRLHIQHEITDVGDANVMDGMIKSGAVLGGEDSGHLIFLKHHTTGDGILSALRLLEVMAVEEKPLSKLARTMEVFPQVLMNVKVPRTKPDFMKTKEISDKIQQVRQILGSKGRVLIRYSGTQPLLRVMVEGPDMETTENCCQQICAKIEKYL